ncbi:hypothetical protein ACU4GD_13165 [Cupriavidus basilensis]
MDVSWIVGLVVPALLYYLAARARRDRVLQALILPEAPGGANATGR